MKAFLPLVLVAFVLGAMWCGVSSQERDTAPVEVIRLTDENWEAVAPRGKGTHQFNRLLASLLNAPLSPNSVYPSGAGVGFYSRGTFMELLRKTAARRFPGSSY